MKTADLEDLYADDLWACDIPFIRLGRRAFLRGPITTVKCYEDNALLKVELSKPGDGRIMIVDGAGSSKAALMGGHLAGLLTANGWGGIIINGAVRDSAEISEMDVAVFCIGTTPKKAGKLGHGVTKEKLRFGGAFFAPGHFVYADGDGVLVSERDFR